jgi:hypothetical protein
MAGFFEKITGLLSGPMAGVVDNIKQKVDDTIQEVEAKIERATVKVIKTSILFIMMFIGVLFMLIGVSQYLNAVVPKLAHGLGTVLVGAILILLAFFARLFRN